MAIGYACNIIGLSDCEFKKCKLENAGSLKLDSLIDLNFNSLERIIDYNIENEIKLFRISSDIIPFGSHQVNKNKWWIDKKSRLLILGEKIKKSDMRVSMHPGQYTIINSPDNNVVKRGLEDLEYHCRFLDSLGVGSKNKIVLHIGGVYGDKKSAIERFKENYLKLSSDIKERLVIENDEKCFNISDVLEIGRELDIPVVFDNLHNEINPGLDKFRDAELIKMCQSTWKQRDGKQKVHYSQQKAEGKIGAHSGTIYIEKFLEFYNTVKELEIDIMLEVKDKNMSACKCIYSVWDRIPINYINKEWARYKYSVLEKNQNIYSRIKGLFRNSENIDVKEFYKLIESAMDLEDNIGNQINAAQHVWGYFKTRADKSEKSKFEKMIEKLENGDIKINSIKNYLYKLSQKYNEDYLIKSHYFFI